MIEESHSVQHVYDYLYHNVGLYFHDRGVIQYSMCPIICAMMWDFISLIVESHSVQDVCHHLYHHVGLYFHDHGKSFSAGCVPSCGTLFS